MLQDMWNLLITRLDFFGGLLLEHIDISLVAIAIAIVFGGMALSGGPKAKSFAAFIGGCTMAFLDLFMSNILSYAEVESGKDASTMLVKAILFLIVAALLGIASRSKQLPR